MFFRAFAGLSFLLASQILSAAVFELQLRFDASGEAIECNKREGSRMTEDEDGSEVCRYQLKKFAVEKLAR